MKKYHSTMNKMIITAFATDKNINLLLPYFYSFTKMVIYYRV